MFGMSKLPLLTMGRGEGKNGRRVAGQRDRKVAGRPERQADGWLAGQ